MADVELTDFEKKVMSYCSRGVSKLTAVTKIAEFFSAKSADVQTAIDKLKRHGYVIESTGVAGVVVYMTSPLKVKSSMIDQDIVATLKEAEQGGKAGGFKRKTFTAHPDTGEIVDSHSLRAKPAPQKRSADLGFDVE